MTSGADQQGPDPWSGALTLLPGMVIYSGPGGSAQTHSHHAIQLIRSLDLPFQLDTDGEPCSCHSAVVPSGTSHSFSSDSPMLLIALIEPLSADGSVLAEIARSQGGTCLDNRLNRISAGEAADPIGVINSSLDSLQPGRRGNRPPLSSAVTSALAYLDTAIDGKPRLEDAASAASISRSRLTHVFTEEVGIPFSKLVLWLRLRRVVEEISTGANLTEAAHAAGFSDSSHLSRVFRENFGLSPSALLGMRVVPGSWPA